MGRGPNSQLLARTTGPALRLHGSTLTTVKTKNKVLHEREYELAKANFIRFCERWLKAHGREVQIEEHQQGMHLLKQGVGKMYKWRLGIHSESHSYK